MIPQNKIDPMINYLQKLHKISPSLPSQINNYLIPFE